MTAIYPLGVYRDAASRTPTDFCEQQGKRLVLARDLPDVGFDHCRGFGSASFGAFLHSFGLVFRVGKADRIVLRGFLKPGFHDELFGVLVHSMKVASKRIKSPCFFD